MKSKSVLSRKAFCGYPERIAATKLFSLNLHRVGIHTASKEARLARYAMVKTLLNEEIPKVAMPRGLKTTRTGN